MFRGIYKFKIMEFLNNDLKKLVEVCFIKSNTTIASEFFARNSFAIQRLKSEFGVDFVKYPKNL